MIYLFKCRNYHLALYLQKEIMEQKFIKYKNNIKIL